MNEEIILKEDGRYDKYGNWLPKQTRSDYNDEQY